MIDRHPDFIVVPCASTYGDSDDFASVPDSDTSEVDMANDDFSPVGTYNYFPANTPA